VPLGNIIHRWKLCHVPVAFNLTAHESHSVLRTMWKLKSET